MEIIQYPDPILSKVSPFFDLTEVESIRETLNLLQIEYKELSRIIKVGLAAPQIGINKHMAIVLGEAMINLEFKPARQISYEKEGCFSIEHATKFFLVERPNYGWATWVNPLTLETCEQKMSGLKARVFQHELDHLNGILCCHI